MGRDSRAGVLSPSQGHRRAMEQEESPSRGSQAPEPAPFQGTSPTTTVVSRTGKKEGPSEKSLQKKSVES